MKDYFGTKHAQQKRVKHLFVFWDIHLIDLHTFSDRSELRKRIWWKMDVSMICFSTMLIVVFPVVCWWILHWWMESVIMLMFKVSKLSRFLEFCEGRQKGIRGLRTCTTDGHSKRCRVMLYDSKNQIQLINWWWQIFGMQSIAWLARPWDRSYRYGWKTSSCAFRWIAAN